MILCGIQYNILGHTITFAKPLRVAEPITASSILELDGGRVEPESVIPQWLKVFFRGAEE